MKKSFLLLLLCPFFVYSQLSFSGVIKDKESKIELEKALVVVKPKRISGAGFYSGVLTEPDGKFEITTSYRHPLEIIVTKKGCTRKVIKIKKGETYFDIVIECESETIEQIIAEKTADSDADGVLDKDDKCKDIAGDVENEGCPWPDDDNDGVNNKEDACPEEAGTASNNGCPIVDSDGDGVADEQDTCPKEPGTASANGCPNYPKMAMDLIQNKESVILFNANVSAVGSEFEAVISNIFSMLTKYPHINLQIAGFASSEGGKTFNQKISLERAESVKAGLIQLGVEASRLKSLGFGEDNPTDSNATPTGGAKNRRVEFSMQ